MKATGRIEAGDLIVVRCGRSWRPGIVVVVDERNSRLVVSYWLGTSASGCLGQPRKVLYADVRGLALALDTDHQRREFRAMHKQIVKDGDPPAAVVTEEEQDETPDPSALS